MIEDRHSHPVHLSFYRGWVVMVREVAGAYGDYRFEYVIKKGRKKSIDPTVRNTVEWAVRAAKEEIDGLIRHPMKKQRWLGRSRRRFTKRLCRLREEEAK